MPRMKNDALSLARALALLTLICGCAGAARAQTRDTYSLPEVFVGEKYEFTIPLVGVRPVKWEVVDGSLPPGIDLGQTTGNLFGWPSTTETKAYVFTIRVTDSAKKATDYQLELVVKGGTPAILLPLKGGGQPRVRAGAAAASAPRTGPQTAARPGTAGQPRRGRAEQPAAGADEEEKEEKEEDGTDEDEAAAKPTLDRPLTEDVRHIRGYVPAKGIRTVTVSVYPAAPEKAAPLWQEEATIGANGRFSLELKDRRLARRQRVVAQAEPTDEEARKSVSETVTVERETRVQTALQDGTQEIRGTAQPDAGQVFADAQIDGEWRQIGVGTVDAKTGAFTIPLENALRRNALVRVYREGAEPLDLKVADNRRPTLRPSPLEGARTVSGVSEDRSAKVQVDVLPEVGSDNPLQRTVPKAVDPDTGVFSVTLDEALTAGQRVRARVENAETWSGEETVESMGDWGRVRGYFTIGMALSKEAETFSSRDLFLNFNIDSNWYHRPLYSDVLRESEQKALVTNFLSRYAAGAAGGDTAAANAIEAERLRLTSALEDLEGRTHLTDEERLATRHVLLKQSLERLKDNSLLTGDRRELINDVLERLERRRPPRGWDLHFNTFFDARLTPVPQSASAASGTGPAAFDEFVTNQKGALVQVGAYAPIFHRRRMTWNYRGNQNAVFFGPVARAGVQTIFDNDRDDLADEEVFEDNDLFNFFAVGARFGHYKLSGTDDRAPQLVSYLDITRGRWQNLERQVPTGEFDADGDEIFVRRRPLRWAVEGRLKIPGLPLQIGFDSNIGEGPDDLRFLFGTNFDISQLFKLLR